MAPPKPEPGPGPEPELIPVTTCSIAYGLPAIAYGLPAHAHLLITCEQAGRAKSGAQTGEASQTVTEAGGLQKAHV